MIFCKLSRQSINKQSLTGKYEGARKHNSCYGHSIKDNGDREKGADFRDVIDKNPQRGNQSNKDKKKL